MDQGANEGRLTNGSCYFYVQDKLECRLSLLTRLTLSEKSSCCGLMGGRYGRYG